MQNNKWKFFAPLRFFKLCKNQSFETKYIYTEYRKAKSQVSSVEVVVSFFDKTVRNYHYLWHNFRAVNTTA